MSHLDGADRLCFAEMVPSKSPEGVRGKFTGSSVSSLVNFTIRAAVLPIEIVEFLEKNAATIQSLLADRRTQQELEAGDDRAEMAIGRGATHVTKPRDFWAEFDCHLKAAGPEWESVTDDVWAFGPKKVGANMLIDRTGVKGRR